eukprot:TRINITY_DN6651_c0_g3_i1.p1 TRINITY_DN6651_c0_g3~~TRINITY_DN6651_c0_g3_i1.p1  ORF type:complete len:160 (-),score=7.52 TRINITY_DN6651_c0_g3_i1:344-763(-)
MALVACTVVSSVAAPASFSLANQRSSTFQSRPIQPALAQKLSGKRCFSVRASDSNDGSVGADAAAAAAKNGTILCPDCDGNGAVQCTQCKGEGVNLEDHFQGRFKQGTTCWLCRGRRQILCGNCNGAGFLGGFMSNSGE